MASIIIKMKNGDTREFPHTGRAAGSYTKSIRYESGFVVITDEYDKEIAIPSSDIIEVITIPTRF